MKNELIIYQRRIFTLTERYIFLGANLVNDYETCQRLLERAICRSLMEDTKWVDKSRLR